MVRHQVLVVGGGLAGLRAAVEALDKGVDVALLSRVHPLRSHSVAAAGGINAALGNHPEGRDDSPERHAFDTVKGSDYLADQDAVEIMCNEAPEAVVQMERWGCPFSRTPEGKIAQRPFGGAGFPRTCYAADRTGKALVDTLFEQALKRGLKVYEEWVAVRLAVEDGECKGVIALSLRDGKLCAFAADAVIFATGGYGRVYLYTTNSHVKSGLGMAVAYWAGVPLKDMEFVQFHPTGLWPSCILITEGARGEGGILVNNRGERFMERYAPKFMELAPRDIVARSMQTEIEEGRGFDGTHLHLDLRHLGKRKLRERLPEVCEIALHFAGIDPAKQPLPVRPVQHYSMGGIDCNADGETVLRGFFAAGECACVSVHGANRLGGNSLLETIVFGRRAGAKAAEYVKGLERRSERGKALKEALRAEEERIEKLARSEGEERVGRLRQELGRLMWEKVGIFRTGDELKEAVEGIGLLKERLKRIKLDSPRRLYNQDLLRAIELEGMLDIAWAIASGALARTESRGSHFRRDFPKRDDANWLKHTLAFFTPEGPKLDYKPVTITKWPPEERKY